MRTTLTIADDVLCVARERAQVESRTVGDIVSDLARAGLTTPRDTAPRPQSDEDAWLESVGIELFPRRGVVVTNEDVNKLRDELFI